MSYICDRCGKEFETPIMVESGGEYGGIAHKDPVSPCCEDEFREVEEYGNVKVLCDVAGFQQEAQY